jgi:hypothetical protein
MTRPTWTFSLALLLPLLLPAAALARDTGGNFQVTTEAFGDSEPSAAMADDGSFIVSWVAGGADVQARRFDPAGAPLAGEFHVGDITSTYPGGTAATLDRSGFLVVWGNEPKHSAAFLLGQRFDHENHPLGEPFSPAGPTDPDVASDPKGNSVIVGAGANGMVATRRNALGQQVGSVIQVSSRASYPGVTVDAAGNFVVTWQGERGIFAQRFSATGSPRGGAVKVTSDISAPALAGNRQGQFIVAWRAGSSLWARFYSPSGQPRTKVLVSNAAVESTFLSAAMDAEGKVLVTWTCCDNSSFNTLYGRWLDRTGAPSGGPFPVSTAKPGRFVSAPDAASGPKDRFLVVWQGDLGSTPAGVVPTIFGRRLAFARPGDDPCLLRRGNFVCDTAHDGGEEELLVPFRGPGSDTPLLGDLDGDGDDDPCRYRPGRLLCDTAHDGGAAELVLAFGQDGDIPLLGDLDGEGRDDACVYRGTQLLCDTAHNGGTAELVVSFNPFGHPLVLPFLADMDGDGDDDPCVARNGQLLCDTEHDGGPEELVVTVNFGAEGEVLLLGDVNNDRRADPCVYRDGRFLCDTRRDGSADLIIPFRGPGAIPLLGNLDGL